jgi:hypothetical protein
MIVRALLPWGINLWNRNRGDLKFVNGLFNPVYRNRLQLEKPLKTGRLGLIAYAYAEAFYDTRYGKFKITDIQPEWSGCWPVSWLSKAISPCSETRRLRRNSSTHGITVQIYLRQTTQ